LASSRPMCDFTVASLITNRSERSALVSPSPTSARTSSSRGSARRDLSRAVAHLRAERAPQASRDAPGPHRRSPARDGADGEDERPAHVGRGEHPRGARLKRSGHTSGAQSSSSTSTGVWRPLTTERTNATSSSLVSAIAACRTQTSGRRWASVSSRFSGSSTIPAIVVRGSSANNSRNPSATNGCAANTSCRISVTAYLVTIYATPVFPQQEKPKGAGLLEGLQAGWGMTPRA